MLRFVTRHIFTGLITILPVLLTLYLIYWFIVSTELMLGELLRFVLPETLYWPGMGVMAGLALVFFIGLLMHIYVVQRLFEKAEQLLYQTPLIKSVYRAIRDFFQFFSPSKDKEFEQVVAVTFDNGMQVIGFVTQVTPEYLPKGLNNDGDSVLVYLPLSYMIGGYTILVPRKSVRILDMSMEEAMRFTLTAGVTGHSPESSPPLFKRQ
ncbi:MAG: DUF502 domain-containing protein [Gammaproteobacteria bacterium]|nr:DUF502 domain-containing protein [Gammaproteobacteria bacterium]MDH5591957.1 DUF502 domain-containing protein [Gammaproteobacteria bacterium]